MIQGVLFDLGSTLIEFNGTWHDVAAESYAALADSLVSQGVSIDRDAFLAAFREGIDAYIRARRSDLLEPGTESVLRGALEGLGISAPPASVLERGLEAMYAVSEARWELNPAAESVLQRLQASGLRLGLISNAADRANVERQIDQNGLRPYFDPILISAGVGIRKPDPRIFQIVLDAWGLPPQQVVMVGDTLGEDILGAQRIGMRHIWLATQAEREDNVALRAEVEPEWTTGRLGDVPDILAAMNQLD